MRPAPFTARGLRRGMREAVPFGIGIFVFGAAFGLVAVQVQLGLGAALAMSVAVYSGSAQLAAANLMQGGQVALATLAVTIVLMNARYLMFGAAVQPWLRQARPAQVVASLLLMGDANWILTMRAIERGETDRAYLAGAGVPIFVGWIGGTAVGVLAGAVLPDPRLMAADLMLPAFAVAMMAMMVRHRRAVILPAAAGAATGVAALPLAGAGLAVIAAGLVGAAVAAAAWRPPAGAA